MPGSGVLDRTGATLDELLELTPAATTLRAYRDAVWTDPATDPALLELCRLRMAQLLGLDVLRTHAGATWTARLERTSLDELSRWPTSQHFGARERAALAFVEQWFLDPSGMSDADCATLRAQLGEPGCAAFTMGIALSEALLRCELALGATAPAGG